MPPSLVMVALAIIAALAIMLSMIMIEVKAMIAAMTKSFSDCTILAKVLGCAVALQYAEFRNHGKSRIEKLEPNMIQNVQK